MPSSTAGTTVELRYCRTGAPWAAGSAGSGCWPRSGGASGGRDEGAREGSLGTAAAAAAGGVGAKVLDVKVDGLSPLVVAAAGVVVRGWGGWGGWVLSVPAGAGVAAGAAVGEKVILGAAVV